METYLQQPYEWFLARHSSELSATTINEVNQVIYHAVLPTLMIASNALVAIAVFAFLLIIDPVLGRHDRRRSRRGVRDYVPFPPGSDRPSW